MFETPTLEKEKKPELWAELDRISAESFSAVEGILEETEKVCPHEKPPSEKEKTILKSMRESIRRFLRRNYQVALFALLAGATDHKDAGPFLHRITETVTENGDIEYSHSDPQTDHVINYFTGKDSLTSDEQWELYKLYDKVRYEDADMKIPSNFMDYTKEQYLSFVDNRYFIDDRERLEAELQELFDMVVPRQYAYDPEFYEAFWEMAEEVGAPNIRWDTREFAPIASLTQGNNRRASYDYSTHTAYIFPGNPFEETISEYSHAKQFAKFDLKKILKGLSETVQTINNAIVSPTTIAEEHDKFYNIPGSTEYEAHKIIEPELEERLKGMAPRRTPTYRPSGSPSYGQPPPYTGDALPPDPETINDN